MLKIKDNVDLKELEKFGLKPKYDEDTGEINAYSNYWYDNTEMSKKNFKIFKKTKETKKLKFRKDKNIYIIDEYYFVRTNFSKYYDTCNFDLLYDLIKADLVEKVGE